jgi:hypothetical protein
MDLCWLDQDDPIVLSADRLTVDFAVYATAIDEMRIIELAENSIGKTRESGPEEIGICLYDTTQYVFEIAYAGEAALILDTVPAEFKVTGVSESAGSASYELANKKDNDKSATIITWEDVPAGMSTLTVTIETRQSPGKGHEKHGPAIIYKPTSCGTLALNDGATAYEVDEFGEPVLDAFSEMIMIAGPSDPLEVEAVCGTKPCAPENLSVTLTAADTLSLDWDDVCVGGDAVVYNVYRGGLLIAEDVTLSEYVDSGLAPGYYCYEVEAEYSEGPNAGNQGNKSEQECETVP